MEDNQPEDDNPKPDMFPAPSISEKISDIDILQQEIDQKEKERVGLAVELAKRQRDAELKPFEFANRRLKKPRMAEILANIAPPESESSSSSDSDSDDSQSSSSSSSSAGDPLIGDSKRKRKKPAKGDSKNKTTIEISDDEASKQKTKVRSQKSAQQQDLDFIEDVAPDPKLVEQIKSKLYRDVGAAVSLAKSAMRGLETTMSKKNADDDVPYFPVVPISTSAPLVVTRSSSSSKGRRQQVADEHKSIFLPSTRSMPSRAQTEDPPSASASVNQNRTKISLHLEGGGLLKPIKLQLFSTDPLSKVTNFLRTRPELNGKQITLQFDGEDLDPSKSCSDYDIEDDDQVDVVAR